MALTANDTLRDKTKNSMREVNDSKKILTITLALAFAVGVLISISFIRNITDPIEELLNATRKIKSGKLQYRIQRKLQNEFGELAESFNDMSASLQEQYHKLQETERLAVVGELAAGMVHEIKNPMAGIKVSMEVLSQESPLNAEDKRVLSRVIGEIDRITMLLQGLRDYATPPKPEMVSLELNQVLESTIKSAQYALQNPKHKRKQFGGNIQFIKEFAADLPRVVADPAHLKQVFLNLILNAVDALEQIPDRQGIITIRTSHEPDQFVQISIADNGNGIEPEVLEKIFKPFYTTKPAGTGLGLAISKRLVEQNNGGSITAGNNPYGPGLEVIITLPAQPLDAGDDFEHFEIGDLLEGKSESSDS